ncbi:uncharacterized protein OCT59_018392 [Rhizophagus irregularis]|uniref:Galactose oxidase n=2 Tax=Rhizophagus irregularis TaxID=588596 RepID=A0A015JC92_RHIIW|nr:hypothetical protein RirG_252290 [Rhizophagus irregularis DAOM 197198w]UZO26146.1 hypothetical protein OCT59_018392 [Rhizophagus irregularis]GBC42150.1 hypothetical protein GLOIN_2v1875868 [Rhizophagus irregularis DAOM 181602=DAOM 197198]
MKKFTLFFITLLYLFQIINAQLNPSLRKLFSAVLVGEKLYIYGGFMDNENANAQKTPDYRFFYLDASISFDTSNLPWRAIPDNVKNLPLGSLSSVATGGVAASNGGANNDSIFFFNNEVAKSVSPVLSYNSLDNVWNTQNLSGVKPIGRNQMRAITDNKGKVYLLTGFDFTVQGVKRTDGLFVCDTINLNCVIKDAPLSRLGYGVTLLPNGNLVYIGGGNRNYIPVSDGFKVIYLYDPINDKWDSKVTTGNIPPADVGITTVLGLSGDKIILFGGNNGDNNNLYVLDTTNYEWYVPQARGKGPVFKRGEHCANVIGKYMVVTFGSNGVLQSKYRSSGESDVLLLDISNDSEYIWKTSFDPTPLTINSTPSNSKPKANNIGVIVGLTIGIIVLISILSISTLFFIRKYKIYKNSKPIPTPGNVLNNEEIMSIPSDYELSHKKFETLR